METQLIGLCGYCGEPCLPWNWFCAPCIAVKEAAYAESRRLGETFSAVIARREAALQARVSNPEEI